MVATRKRLDMREFLFRIKTGQSMNARFYRILGLGTKILDVNPALLYTYQLISIVMAAQQYGPCI